MKIVISNIDECFKRLAQPIAFRCKVQCHSCIFLTRVPATPARLPPTNSITCSIPSQSSFRHDAWQLWLRESAQGGYNPIIVVPTGNIAHDLNCFEDSLHFAELLQGDCSNTQTIVQVPFERLVASDTNGIVIGVPDDLIDVPYTRAGFDVDSPAKGTMLLGPFPTSPRLEKFDGAESRCVRHDRRWLWEQVSRNLLAFMGVLTECRRQITQGWESRGLSPLMVCFILEPLWIFGLRTVRSVDATWRINCTRWPVDCGWTTAFPIERPYNTLFEGRWSWPHWARPC